MDKRFFNPAVLLIKSIVALFMPSAWPNRATARFARTNMLATTSTGLLISTMVLFFVDNGLTVTIGDVTQAATIGGLAGLAAIPVAGKLAHLYSARSIYSTALLFQALVLFSWNFVSTSTTITIAVVGFSLSTAMINATVGSFITELGIPATNMAMTRAALRTITNIGIGFGGLLAALCLRFGSEGLPIAIGLAGVFTFLGFLNLWRTRTPQPRKPRRTDQPAKTHSSPYKDPRYVGLFLSNGVLSTHTEVLTYALPAVVLFNSSGKLDIVGLCTAVNALLVILFQLQTTRKAATLKRTTSIVIATSATLMMTVFLGGSGHLPSVIKIFAILAAVVALTVGELWQSSVEFDVSYAAAPEGNHQEFQAAYAFGRMLARAAAPISLGWVIANGNTGWLALGIVYLAAGTLHVTLTRSLPRTAT